MSDNARDNGKVGFFSFARAAHSNMRGGRVKESVDAQEPTAEENEAGFDRSMSAWCDTARCKDEFLPFLDQWIENLDALRRSSIDSHAKLTYAEGGKDVLTDLRAHFKKWAG